ncbi:MAG TPA: universal stress protein [Acidimicrobiales bacterium]|nr:universal stress protein [Acidimicrobiales bacterium]
MYGRVLVGTDGSDTARRAVERAVEVAEATGSSVTIVSVGDPDRALAVAQAEAERHSDAGVDIAARACQGDPAAALVEAAEAEGAGLLVVGSRGMTGPARLLGSVPNKVSHHAPCHLLIVHTT